MPQRSPGCVLVVDLGLTVWDIRSGYKDPFGLCPACRQGAYRLRADAQAASHQPEFNTGN